MAEHRLRVKVTATLVALLGLASLTVGAWLAWHHPVAPLAVLVAFFTWSAAVAWRPSIWLFAVPAALPFLNFAPWTGWIVVEEFDLLLLGTAAGAYARRVSASVAPAPTAATPQRTSGVRVLFIGAALLFGLASIVSLDRGVSAAGGLSPLRLGWFQGYSDPLNSWRVFKSVAWAALLWPLLRREIGIDAESVVRRLAAGMLAGLAIVTLATVWERAAYPGLGNFKLPYRATALFWEMHVGGAAIDGYLALAVPFVAWALWSARSPARWCAAAVLALFTGYVCLTTFSRGVYFAVAAPLAMLGLQLASQQVEGRLRSAVLRVLAIGAVLLGVAVALGFAIDAGGVAGGGVTLLCLATLALVFRCWVMPMRRRSLAAIVLAMALLFEVVAVLGLGSFMRERVSASSNDMGHRIAHWRHGLGLLRSPSDWLWGIDSGRLPAEYAARVPKGEFPGAVEFVPGQAEHGSVQLFGPKTRADLNNSFALTQRVALRPDPAPQVEFEVRAATSADVYVDVCEMHLLYARNCQSRFVHIPPDPTAWRRVSLRLLGPSLTVGDALAPRLAVFSIAVVNAGGAAEFDNFSLVGPDRTALLVNGDFSRGLAQWLPAAQGYYVPWHIDNLYLELLIERGWPALLAFVTCMGLALRLLLGCRGRATPIAPFLAAALCGALCVGLFSSVMDAPRVAFLMLLLSVFAVELVIVRRPGRT